MRDRSKDRYKPDMYEPGDFKVIKLAVYVTENRTYKLFAGYSDIPDDEIPIRGWSILGRNKCIIEEMFPSVIWDGIKPDI